MYIRTDTPITAGDMVKMAQVFKIGQVLFDPPAFLESFVVQSLEACISPGGAVDFWQPDEGRSVTAAGLKPEAA